MRLDLAEIPFDVDYLTTLAEKLERDIEFAESKKECEDNFGAFIEQAWNVIDPAEYEHNWHIDAVAQHLEAVAFGEIRKLVINYPPRHAKTVVCSVMFPCWLWIHERDPDYPLLGPQAKMLCMSYGEQVAFDAAIASRRLIESEWYQERWGDRVKISSDQAAKGRFDTTAGGTRISTAMGGQVLGRGGDIRIIDDPIKADDANSEVIRENVINTYEETLRSRVTDPRTTATVLVGHRVHESDLFGHVLSREKDWVHLCIPEEYDSRRHCHTVIGWDDPRTEDGQLLWESRFDSEYLAPYKANQYVWAGQYQQIPAPKGGGIFKSDWWQLWPPEGETFDERGNPIDPVTGEPKPLTFPNLDYILVSLDTALTEKQENDWSACTVWGTFEMEATPTQETWMNRKRFEGVETQVRCMLLYAWQARLSLHDLVERVVLTARGKEKRKRRDGTFYEVNLGWKADSLVVEAAANGWSVIQEIVRLCRKEEFGVYPWNPRTNGGGDIVARAHAVSHLWAGGLVYAPDRDWASLVIDNMASLPKAAHDDLASSAIQAAKFLRDKNILQTRGEREDQLNRLGSHRQARKVPLPYNI